MRGLFTGLRCSMAAFILSATAHSAAAQAPPDAAPAQPSAVLTVSVDPPAGERPAVPDAPAPDINYAPVTPAPDASPDAVPQAILPPAALPPAGPPHDTLPPAERPAHDANRLDTPATTLEKAGETVKDLATGDLKALQRGPLLMHGNYCGIGNRPGTAPVDVLDAACKRHDACTQTGSLPNCACDERFGHEAAAIAADPARTDALRALAASMAASMAILICK